VGKYSIALEKIKDETAEKQELFSAQSHNPEELQQSDNRTDNQQTLSVEKTQRRTVLEQSSINSELEGWDAKLFEIIAGDSQLVAESFRILRTKIFHPDSGEVPRSILITSAIPGEGKSFICASLGISIAQGLEKEALIVECDLRRPILSKLFGLPNSRGLVDYLSSGAPIDQLIQQTSLPKLSLLPCGKPPNNPADLIDTQKMASLLEKLQRQNSDRLIILDSPPVQAASETDILAKKADKVILVVRSGYARKEHTRQLVEILGRDKIIGIVFNAFEMTRLEAKLQGYYHGYKDYYSSFYTKYYAQENPKKKNGKRKFFRRSTTSN
jgi:protein-tyrosine kinase